MIDFQARKKPAEMKRFEVGIETGDSTDENR